MDGSTRAKDHVVWPPTVAPPALPCTRSSSKPSPTWCGAASRRAHAGRGSAFSSPSRGTWGAETAEEAAALAAAREQGYFVGVMSIDALIRFVPAEGHDPGGHHRYPPAARSRPPPEGQVHVLGALQGCVAAVTARANPEIVGGERPSKPLRACSASPRCWRGESRRSCAGPPRASRRPGTVFVVVDPDEPAVQRLRGITVEACAAARAEGVYVGLHDAADAIAALPLEALEAEDGLRATRRLTAPIPRRVGAGGRGERRSHHLRHVARRAGVPGAEVTEGRRGIVPPMRRLVFAQVTLDDLESLATVEDRGRSPSPSRGKISRAPSSPRRSSARSTYVSAGLPALRAEPGQRGDRLCPGYFPAARARGSRGRAGARRRAAAGPGRRRRTSPARRAAPLGRPFAGEMRAPFLVVVEAKRGVEGTNPVAPALRRDARRRDAQRPGDGRCRRSGSMAATRWPIAGPSCK